MKSEKEITCIVCPIGCKVEATLDDKTILKIKGNQCAKGLDYARDELIDPRRTLTSSMLVVRGEWPLVSVKSSAPIPKKMLFPVLKRIKETKVNAAVEIGDVLIENVLDTGVDIIATRNVKKLKPYPSPVIA